MESEHKQRKVAGRTLSPMKTEEVYLVYKLNIAKKHKVHVS